VFIDSLEAKSNLRIVARERGKIVHQRDVHNIVPDVGRQWLSELIVGESAAYITQMGPGIGSTTQTNSYVDVAPFDDYPVVGAKSQTDTDPAITSLERPVRVSGADGPIVGTDVWLKSVSAPTHPTTSSTRLTCIFTELEVSYGSYSTVPISELGLFTSDKNPNNPNEWLAAYDSFDPIPKSSAIELEVRWTLIF